MKILQSDIFGEKHNSVQEKEKKQSLAASPKPFKDISIHDGINEGNATSEAMLIHRVIQKKIMYSGISTEKQREVLMRVLINEMKIKSGECDATTATRDSLITFFGK